MQVIRIGTKNQIVLPKEVRTKIQGLKPGKTVLVYPLNENTVALQVETKTWTERTKGSMKDAWKDIHTTKYLDKLRNEWDEK
ncbi:MAG: AbrB/MazE/SpoVT family DNA-binding domain-containing protein [Candidatus Levyibacteriota bacterium]